MSSLTLPAALFRRVCAQFATGVAVVTTAAGDRTPHGLTVNSFCSLSLNPPLVLVAIARDCSILAKFESSAYFAVNILRESQQSLSIRFAELPEGRFTSIAWRHGITGSPLIEDVLAVLECRTIQTIDTGDHRALIGEVVAAECHDGKPLVFFNSGYERLE